MAFKMKGFSGFKEKSPLKINGDPKRTLKKVKSKSLSDREKRIARNKQFNDYAVKKGIIPDFNKIKDDRKRSEKMKNFYGNKQNLSMIKKEQEKYFK